MLQSLSAVVAASLFVASGVQAQRPADQSICDFYTAALLQNNTAANQLTVLTALVNTAVIGNYTIPGVSQKNAVPGILASNASFMGKSVNLVPYFSGQFVSTNRDNKSASVNFLDGGAAAALMMNKPTLDNATNSNQHILLTHLYSFFGTALNCSQVGKDSFPAYQGSTSMYEVHKFMALDSSEVGYFIQQVGLSAQSFGVTMDDVEAVGTLLTNAFDRRCSPAAAIGGTTPELQAICTADDCQEASPSNCSAYEAFKGEPANATGTATSAGGGASSTGGAGSGGSGGSGGAMGLKASMTGAVVVVASLVGGLLVLL